MAITSAAARGVAVRLLGGAAILALVAVLAPNAHAAVRADGRRAATGLQSVGTHGVRLKQPVQELAADGNRVAYGFCGQLVAWWQPGSRHGGKFGTPANFQCPSPSCCAFDYSLAVAGDHVAWAANEGGIQTNSLVSVASFAHASTPELVAFVGACCRGEPTGEGRLGFVVGQGSTLVFTSWILCGDPGAPSCGLGSKSVTSSDVTQVMLPLTGGTTCPTRPWTCKRVTTGASLLGAVSTDSGRIAIVRADGSLVVVDLSGNRLGIVQPGFYGSVVAAELWQQDLVVLTQGHLVQLDAATGFFVRQWPLPIVPSGGPCRRVPCGQSSLRLEDAARGLAAYTYAGAVHLLRLSDGRDVVAGPGTAARFVDSGLVYAYHTTGVWPDGLRWLTNAQLASLLGP
jgi:hypothetical protein